MDDDAAQLAALGVHSEFKRDMNLWANFSLGFTYLSPVVGIYTVFAYSIAAAGPPMIWSLLIAGVGQLLVALVFSEVVAQFPVAGGVYPWARQLWGRRWAWMTGWVYLFALMATIAGVAFGAGRFTAGVVGFTPSLHATIVCALAILIVATATNLSGTKMLSYAAIFGFAAELIGALVVGLWLLIAQRHHGLGVLFDSFGAQGHRSFLDAFLAASLIGVYQYYGFEACGDVAEEVKNPGVQIPKAMRRTIYIGGAAATFVCVSLTLSVVDVGAIVSGSDADPISTILASAFGTVGSKIVLGVVLISFVSCALSLQAAASRLIYSYGRDDMIVGASLWKRFDHRRHVPPFALLLAAIGPGALIVASIVSTDALTRLVSFGSIGIYIAFQMVVLAALRARARGWTPTGNYRLGAWAWPINIGALTYGSAAIANIAWPRTPRAPWYDNYSVALVALTVIVAGVLYMAIARFHNGPTTAHGDSPDTTPGPAVAPRPVSTPETAKERDVH